MQNVKKSATEATKAVGQTSAPLQKQKMSLTEVFSATQLVAQGFQVMKQGYNLAKEGAQIEFLKGKFDNLSMSIGTTSEALLGDLQTATKGTLSDMELMASAADLVGLGLANSHDEAVRLASVSAGLNMDMNQLVLTLTNMTTMRFDALGVRVDGFKERVEALEDAGYSADAAFKEAFLQQAEAQLKKVGNAADSTAGSFMRLEAATKNMTDRWKEMAGDALAPTVEAMVDAAEAAERVDEEYGDLHPRMRNLMVALDAQAHNWHEGKMEMLAARAAIENIKDEMPAMASAMVAATVDAEEALSALNSSMGQLADYMANDLSDAQEDYNEKIAEYKQALEEAKTAEERGDIQAKIEEETAAYNERAKAIMFNIQQSALLAAAESGTLSGEQIQQLPSILNELASSYGLIDETQKRAIDSTNSLIGQWQEGAISQETLAQGLRNQTQYTQEYAGALTEAGSSVNMYSSKTKNLIGRTEDAVEGFESLNDGIGNVAQAFVDAHGPVSSVVMDLGGLPPSGTSWAYFFDIQVSGRVPSLSNIPDTGSACFIAGTPVTMADGSTKAIEDIQPGDRVLSYDTDRRRQVSATVLQVFHHPAADMGDYYLTINGIGVTPNHLVYSAGHWRPAEALRIGAPLLDVDGNAVPVRETGYVGERVPTYNLHTSHETHNYFAGGVLVHNAKTEFSSGGGMIDPSKYTIVGDAPGGGFTPYTEVITPEGKVLPNKEARALKAAGMLEGATSAAFGTEDVIFSQGSGTLYAQQMQKRKARRTAAASPVTGGGGESAETTALQLAMNNEANAEIAKAEVAQQAAINLTRETNNLMAQMLGELKRISNKTPTEEGIAKASYEGASKFS